jgi:hypothetical protein
MSNLSDFFYVLFFPVLLMFYAEITFLALFAGIIFQKNSNRDLSCWRGGMHSDHAYRAEKHQMGLE